jgi:hypothetical protein
MPFWIPMGIVVLGGAVGGIINAIISDNGFIFPREETIENVCIVRPGVIGNVLLGAVASFVSWGLYGSYSGVFLLGESTGAEEIDITLSAIAGAILIGIGGARWLTNEVDKNLLKTAAITAAAASPSPGDSQRMVVASPAQAFSIAKNMLLKDGTRNPR